jgi:thiamine pyrophosphokinase
VRIAADGGAVNAHKHFELAPHVVIGDFDSMNDAARIWCENAHAEFIRYPSEKNETDLELALNLARERGTTELTVLGAIGGRFDQMISNVLLLIKPAQLGISTRIAGIDFEAQIATKSTTVIGKIGETISLIPLTERVDGIVTQGLRYPLRNETLYLGTARGVSNELVAELGLVSFASGLLLITHLFDHDSK